MISRRTIALAAAAAGWLPLAAPATAQNAEPADLAAPAPLAWQRGPGTAPIGSGLAEIDLDEGYVFLDAGESQRFMELLQNPVSGDELATVAPISDGENWFVVFEFDDIGYVDDSEKDSLDADAMLASIREGTERSNEERRRRGWAPMTIVGWHEEPHYDPRTNNLSWAIVGESQGGRSINRIVKLLGRRGVMTATLVSSPEELAAAIPATDALLEGFRYRPGSTYAEYLPGKDKLAQYGLTALVVGGGAAALASSGLLVKLWKPIAAGLVAIGAALKRMFMSGRSAEHDLERPIG
jgi:uncharacterized membrane-anchored protein